MCATKKDISYNKNSIENVLINSNFTCGFFINESKLYKILKFKYGIHTYLILVLTLVFSLNFIIIKIKKFKMVNTICHPKSCFSIDKKR